MVSSTVENTPKTNGSLAAATSTTSIQSQPLSLAGNEVARGSPAPQGTPTQAPPAPAQAKAQTPKDDLPSSIEDYDHFLNTMVQKYVDVSNEIGGKVKDQAIHVKDTFAAIRQFLLVATKANKPDQTSPEFAELLKPLQKAAAEVVNIKEASRGDPTFNHLSAVADSIGVISWVMIEHKPYAHVDESLGSAKYYGIRVQKEFKEKNPKHIEWLQAYYAIFTELCQFLKDNYPNGVVWNANGVPLKEALQSSQPAAAAAPPAPLAPGAGGPPPPPPPPGPAPRFEINEAPSPGSVPVATDGLGAVFSELNKGSAVTAGLKKVSASEMTHKNPSLRASSQVPERSDSNSSNSSINRARSPAPRKTPKPEGLRAKKPPKKELQGNKWIIENYEDEQQPIEIEAEISHSILVSRCNKTTIIVKGKANAITVDNSSRLSLVIDSLVSSVDVIKSANFAMQVMGTLPTILMDQVDGAQVYLSKESMNTEVFSSKCSSVNLNIMEEGVEDADYKEVALPEQIRTWIENGKVMSEIVEHAG